MNMEMILERYGRRKRIVCYVFIAAIGVLYAANFILRAFAGIDGVLKLAWNYGFPLVVVSGIYILDWNKQYSSNLLYHYIPKLEMLAFCVPAVMAFLGYVGGVSETYHIDFSLTVFAMTSMCITPYALRNVQRSCVAIVIQTVVFILIAAKVGNNTAAMVTIVATAVALICCLPKLNWLYPDEEYHVAKVIIALVTLFAIILLLVLIQETGILKAFYVSSLGRPGYGSSALVNQQCRDMVANAKFIGSTPIVYPPDGIFAHRDITYILSQCGWLAVAPILLAMLLMITCGWYLCHKSFVIHTYISVAFMAVITVQTVGYVLMCAGWDLLFPELCPFLDGDFYTNTLFLLMAVCVLPSKRKSLEEFDDDDENEDA